MQAGGTGARKPFREGGTSARQPFRERTTCGEATGIGTFFFKDNFFDY